MCTSHSVFNIVSPLALNSLLSFLLLNKTAWFILDIPQTFIEKKNEDSKFWLYPGDPIPTDEF